MGRDCSKASGNVYFEARKAAAEYDDRLYSREKAAELLGVSVSTLADYENGNTKFVPVDKVVLMADSLMSSSAATPASNMTISSKASLASLQSATGWSLTMLAHTPSARPASSSYPARKWFLRSLEKCCARLRGSPICLVVISKKHRSIA